MKTRKRLPTKFEILSAMVTKVCKKKDAIILSLKENIPHAEFINMNLGFVVKKYELAYMFIAGKYAINKYANAFPCFTRTLGFYTGPADVSGTTAIRNHIKNQEFINISKLQISQLFEYSCGLPNNVYLLTEHFNNGISLETMIRNYENNEFFVSVIIPNMLIQIYLPLIMLYEKFEHNFLNEENIIFCKVKDDGYVTMKYELGDTIVTIATNYIVKIKDYAYCKFQNEIINSQQVYDLIPNKCRPNNNTTHKFNDILFIKWLSTLVYNWKFNGGAGVTNILQLQKPLLELLNHPKYIELTTDFINTRKKLATFKTPSAKKNDSKFYKVAE